MTNKPVYTTIDKRNACQAFICLPEKDDSTVYIAFPSQSNVENVVMSSMTLLGKVLSEKQIEHLREIEFINIHDALPPSADGGVSSKEKALQMDAERLHALILDIAKTQSEEQDKLWEALEAKDCVYTGLVPFLMESELSTIASRKITHKLSTPQRLVEYICEKISSAFHIAKSDVWVSTQIVTGRDALRSWNDFHTQAYDKLVCDIKYLKHIYDEQTQEAGKPIVPIYGIFLAIHKRWPRRIPWREFCRFSNLLTMTSFTDRDDMIPYFKDISPDSMPILPRLYDIATFQKFYSEYATVADAVCRNEYDPEKYGSEKNKAGGVLGFLRRVFQWMK